MKTSRGYKRWLARLESGVLTYGQCLQFCHMSEGRGKRTSCTAEELNMLYHRFFTMPDGLALSDEPGKWYDLDEKRYLTWTEFGRKWVARNGKRAGLPAEMVAAADRLTFRFVDVGVGYPVYRATDPATGRSWHYNPTPWQVRLYR